MRLRRLLVLFGVMLTLCAVVSLTVVALALAQETVPAEQLAAEGGQFVEVNGASLYYIEAGPQDGPAVLLLHGFGGSVFTWRDNIAPLAQAGYRVIAFDRPPYGLADKDTDIEYSNTNYADLTVGLMDALGIESAALVGHSAGGGVIAQFAVMYPDRVDALAYVAGAVRLEGMQIPTPEPEEGEGQASPFAPLFQVASQIDPNSPVAVVGVRLLVTPDLLERIALGNYYDPETVSEDVLAGYTQVLQVEGWEGAFLKLLSMDRGFDEPFDTDALLSLEVPVLIVWGENDPTVPLVVGEVLAEALPEAQFVVYPTTGHMPMEERTEQFNADLLGFLNSVYE